MEASAGLVAGSHNRNELVVIPRDGEPGGVCSFLPVIYFNSHLIMVNFFNLSFVVDLSRNVVPNYGVILQYEATVQVFISHGLIDTEKF